MDKLRLYLNSLDREQKNKFQKISGLSMPYLRKAICLKHKMEPANCVKIEIASNGSITRKDLREDWEEIWPELVEE
jgi:DNA-binding transcriptional regulator YdaS (Cro superfamily)